MNRNTLIVFHYCNIISDNMKLNRILGILLILIFVSSVFAAENDARYFVKSSRFNEEVKTTIVNPNEDPINVDIELEILNEFGQRLEYCGNAANPGECVCLLNTVSLDPNKALDLAVGQVCIKNQLNESLLSEGKYSVNVDITCVDQEIYCKDNKKLFVSVLEDEPETVGVSAMPLIFVIGIAGAALFVLNRKNE